MKLSDDLQISLTVAISEAGRLGHEYAGLEHLLYALTFDEETARVLKNAGADLDRIREDLAEYLSDELEKIEDEDVQPRLTLGVQRVLSMAAARVDGTGKEEIRGSDVLVALFDEADSYAVQVLESEGVTRLDVVSYLAHGVSRLQPPYFGGVGGVGGTSPSGLPAGDGDDEDDEEEGGQRNGPAGDPLKAFAQDLTPFPALPAPALPMASPPAARTAPARPASVTGVRPSPRHGDPITDTVLTGFTTALTIDIMFERFTAEARAVVVRAQEEARDFRHDHIGTEHVLLGLLAMPTSVAALALRQLGVSATSVRAAVVAGRDRGATRLPGISPLPRVPRRFSNSLCGKRCSSSTTTSAPSTSCWRSSVKARGLPLGSSPIRS